MKKTQPDKEVDTGRRRFLGTAGAGLTAAAARPAWGGSTLMDAMGSFFQDHYQRMSADEIADAIGRIERRAQRRFGVDITCKDVKP
ncbi:MAG: 4Fe-4S ferredoxin, partial [Wenzhouxiangella sp.]|nr:4Fe-4S ferredoxin [Wenzhouxiangella sp.]